MVAPVYVLVVDTNKRRHMSDSLAIDLERFHWVICTHDPELGHAKSNRLYVYTVGLMEKFGQPEILIVGLGPEDAYDIIERVGQELAHNYRSPLRSEEWQLKDLLPQRNRCCGVMLHKDHISRYMPEVVVRCEDIGQPLKAIQLLWPDEENNLPGELECDPWYVEMQMLDPSEI